MTVKWLIRPASYSVATHTSLKRAMFGSLDSDTESVSGKKDIPATEGTPDPDSAEVHSLPPADMIPGLMRKKNSTKEEVVPWPRIWLAR